MAQRKAHYLREDPQRRRKQGHVLDPCELERLKHARDVQYLLVFGDLNFEVDAGRVRGRVRVHEAIVVKLQFFCTGLVLVD